MINRNMQKCILEKKEKVKQPSGATKETWTSEKEIEVAIYDIDDRINTQSAKFNSSTHTGLTTEKNMREGINRLNIEGTIYTIEGCKLKGRLTQLLLKKVDTNV